MSATISGGPDATTEPPREPPSEGRVSPPILREARAGHAAMVVFAGLCLVGRMVAYRVIRAARRRHLLRQRTLLLGAGSLAGSLAANLLDHPEYGLTPEGMLDDDPMLAAERES